jgi:glycerol-3-phosphate acyltransferase PlsY
MQPIFYLLFLIPVGYLLGSIPFGLIVGRANGIDPRTAGSRNIGATNVGRLLGRKFFFVVFALDLLKSFVPMAVASALVQWWIPPMDQNWLVFTVWLSVGLAAILGHMFSLFLKFKGGKGVSASAGVMLGLIPYYTLPGILSVGIFLIVLKASKYVSLASMAGASAFPVIYLVTGLIMKWPLFGAQLPLLLLGAMMPALIVYRHRANIARLRAGTESRIGSTPPPRSEAA